MVMINYPEPHFKTKKEGGKDLVFDPQRRRWVVLTPEEWVRLNFVQYLIKVKKYPSPLIAVEKELKLGELKKRFDILVYDKDHRPWMMVECKSTFISLNESVLHQVLRYNIAVPVPFIVITNGDYCFAGSRKDDELQILSELPMFSI